jgi:chemosensory pili system protein ChpA (sensor histidine kinase/response regulator)
MAKRRILVVDDTETVLLFQRLSLGPEYDYDTAKNGLKALEVARLRKPDLILLDLKMPEMDGLAFLRQLRDDASLEDVPVIVCTTKNTPTHVKAAFDAGCSEFCAKPIDRIDLGRKVKRLLGEKVA